MTRGLDGATIFQSTCDHWIRKGGEKSEPAEEWLQWLRLAQHDIMQHIVMRSNN
jgi:hypothetical protein